MGANICNRESHCVTSANFTKLQIMFHKIKRTVLSKRAHHPNSTPQTSPLHRITGVYFSNWSIYERNHFPTDIDYEKVDHVFYAFLLIDKISGSVLFLDTWGDLQVPLNSPNGGKVHGTVAQLRELKAIHPHLKVSFSIGGWGTDDLFQAVVTDRRKVNAFVDSCVELLLKHGFDGIDIDWEYPKTPAQGHQLLFLLSQLRLALDQLQPGLILSAAVSGVEENICNLNVPEMDQLLDYWNVMCYDFTGSSWSERTGYHSNLFGDNGDSSLCADSMMKAYLKRGATNHKLLLGMPLYGRKFYGVSNPNIGQPFNKNLCKDEGTIEYKKLPIGRERYDPRKVGAFCYDEKEHMFVTYDSIETVKVKAAYVASNKFGGGFFWDSAGDKDGVLINLYSQILRDRENI